MDHIAPETTTPEETRAAIQRLEKQLARAQNTKPSSSIGLESQSQSLEDLERELQELKGNLKKSSTSNESPQHEEADAAWRKEALLHGIREESIESWDVLLGPEGATDFFRKCFFVPGKAIIRKVA